jgi:hypothetical protein
MELERVSLKKMRQNQKRCAACADRKIDAAPS